MRKCSLDAMNSVFAEISKAASLYLPVDGTDGAAECDGAVAVDGGSDRNHDFREGGTDGHHGSANDDLRQMKAFRHADRSVHEPVAAFDEQEGAQNK